MLRRVTLGLLAALALLSGVACGVAAVWTALVLGSADGVLRYEIGAVTAGADSASLILDVDRFEADVPYIASWGETSFAVQSESGTALFLGAAPTPQADAYLRGVPYSVGVRSAGEWQVRDVPGVTQAQPPAEQAIWIEQAEGARPAISIPTTRPVTLVILPTDGGTLGRVDLGVDFTVPEVARYILWLSIASVMLVLLGLLLVFLAIQRLRPGKHAAPKPVRGRHAAGYVEEVRDEQPVG